MFSIFYFSFFPLCDYSIADSFRFVKNFFHISLRFFVHPEILNSSIMFYKGTFNLAQLDFVIFFWSNRRVLIGVSYRPWKRTFEEVSARTLSLLCLYYSTFFGGCQGVSHTFFWKVRGRERPHRDLNPVPHWLAEVNLSLPLTSIIIADNSLFVKSWNTILRIFTFKQKCLNKSKV